MPKIELSVTEQEKTAMRYAAEKENLRLATWAKAKLMGLADKAMPVQVEMVESPQVDVDKLRAYIEGNDK